MANPIVDLGTTVTLVGGPMHQGSVRIERRRTRQAKPYNLPAPYLDSRRFINGVGMHAGVDALDGLAPWYLAVPYKMALSEPLVNACMMKARERFIAKLRDRVALGTAIGEYQSSARMIGNRCKQIFDAWRAIRKGRVDLVADALGVSRGRALPKNRSKKFSSNFLEWHFGWAPLLGDIWNACNILANPLRPHKVEGYAKIEREKAEGGHSSPGQSYSSGRHTYTVKCCVGGFVRIENPNLTMNPAQWGLTNPLLTAWELVPWSFLVDHFVNVSDWLGQLDEMVGLELLHPYHSWKVAGESRFDEYIANYPNGVFDGTYRIGGTIIGELAQFERALGVPAVELAFKRVERLSLTRAVTYASLLAQRLRG